MNETLTSSTKEVGKAALEKQIEEINEQIRKEEKKRKLRLRMRQASKNAEKSAGGGETEVSIGQKMICNYSLKL